MLDKLWVESIRGDVVKVFETWLPGRKALVICGGQQGNPIQLKNMIYQNTVCGPWLWNLFYGDATLALRVHDFLEIVFAYDLNAFRLLLWQQRMHIYSSNPGLSN